MFPLLIGALCAALVAGFAQAYQGDAAFIAYQEQHQSQWRKQDACPWDKKLAALRTAQGKRPNIIYILADDIGWGELGSYGGGKLRGTPTPQLDELAQRGMKFLSHYSEPSCTPTRVALMTGRIPVRTGLDEVLFPGQTKGLVAEELTLAEVLSQAGYSTAMFGKWHLGELSQHQPTNQGFDYAFYGMYNGGPWPWEENARYFDPANHSIEGVPYFQDMPTDYESRFWYQVYTASRRLRKARPPREVARMSLARYNRHDDELTEKILTYIEQQSRRDNPFFVYFASNANQVFACPPEHRQDKYVDPGNCQAAQFGAAR